MQFREFKIPGAYPDADPYFAYMAEVKRHGYSLGWEEVPKEAEAAIEDAWIKHLERVPGVVVAPEPSRCRRHVSIGELGEDADEIEAEFTLKVLAAIRRCLSPGERMLAIDWLHSWYYFDPHGAIRVATRDEWAMPILPDIDSYNFVAQDYRFGILTGFDGCWFVKLFGASLLAAFATDPPQRFLNECGQGAE